MGGCSALKSLTWNGLGDGGAVVWRLPVRSEITHGARLRRHVMLRQIRRWCAVPSARQVLEEILQTDHQQEGKSRFKWMSDTPVVCREISIKVFIGFHRIPNPIEHGSVEN
ncbi:hypothetical protein EJB05_28884 [Eragrostis curvula]|uniref:Uncharacterized protein n=1 Tax=Eragrostis curvula TaxID=38414 RepID=A0A5J9URE9_9POAL|nr:hypothetical protein EJB05_28884 [Eragrostis curvula]